MANVIDLGMWRRDRRRRGPDALAEVEDRSGLDRLEGAIERLAPLVAGVLDGSGHVQPPVETELLAIIGELTVGLISEATGRAERLERHLKEVKEER